MTPKTSAALKKRSKLSKKLLYESINKEQLNTDKEQLNTYSKHCSEIAIDAQDKFLNKLSK